KAAPHTASVSRNPDNTSDNVGGAGASVTSGRASADGAALLERAPAPSRPEPIAPREQRAGVASCERESSPHRPIALARSGASSLDEHLRPARQNATRAVTSGRA